MSAWAWASMGAKYGMDLIGGNHSSRQQYQRQKKMYQHRYQWTVKDLESAGLNPMLAYSQGAPVPGGVSAADQSQIGSRAVEGFQKQQGLNIQKKAMESQLEVNSTQASKNLAEAKDALSSASLKELDIQARQQTVPLAGAKANEELRLVTQQVQNAMEELKRIQAEAERARSESERAKLLAPVEAKLKDAERRSVEAGIPVKKFQGEVAEAASGIFGINWSSLGKDTANWLEDRMGDLKEDISSAKPPRIPRKKYVKPNYQW